MEIKRKKTFETNSSSTHSLVLGGEMENYTPYSSNLKIRWIDTDDEMRLTTLKDKVSYLVSHIASWYMYDVNSYAELVAMIKTDYQFKEIEDVVNKVFHKQIIFPSEYHGDIEEIVGINHQLISWDKDLGDILIELLQFDHETLLKIVLANGNIIEFGRD